MLVASAKGSLSKYSASLSSVLLTMVIPLLFFCITSMSLLTFNRFYLQSSLSNNERYIDDISQYRLHNLYNEKQLTPLSQYILSQSLIDCFAPYNDQNVPMPPFMNWVETVFENFQSDTIMNNFDYESKMNMGDFARFPIELIALHLLPFVADDSAGSLSMTCKGFFCLVR